MPETRDENINKLVSQNAQQTSELINKWIDIIEDRKYSPAAVLMASRAILLGVLTIEPELILLNAALAEVDNKTGKFLI